MASFQEISVFGKAGSQKSGKSDSIESAGTSRQCQRCGSAKLWQDGNRYSMFGDKIQQWLCCNCDYRFSDPEDLQKAWSTFERVERIQTKSLKTEGSLSLNRQICAGVAKNLDAEQQKIEVPRRSEIDVKGKLVEYAFWMQKQGYDSETIRGWQGCLKALASENADLSDKESVKEVLAKDLLKKKPRWGQNRRRNIINAYTLFLRINAMQVWDKWDKPKCEVVRKFPFIPTEQEIDALIAGSGRKNAAYAQLLKETAMRPGEGKSLQWINIDSERNIITLNEPEKGSNPRMWKVSSKLISMLNSLPKTSEQIFTASLKSMKTTWTRTRKRLAETLQNPRLKKITFYTLRHWKATMEYHRVKDIVYVQQLLGHKEVKNTSIYINIEYALFGASENDEFTVRVTEKTEEIKALLETGFEYVCQKDGLAFLRKRK